MTATGRIFAMLGAWLIFQGVWYWLSTLLNSMGDVRIQTIWNCIQLCLLLCCGIPLAAHLGLFGLVLAMTIATAVGAVVPLAYRVRTKLEAASHEGRLCVGTELASVSEALAE